MSTKDFPQEFLRGLSNKDFAINGLVMASAFQFDEADRDDGMLEASINWLDDDGAIEVALQQRKENGRIQFVGGVARIDIQRMKLILQSIPSDMFSHERAELPNNPYHGNLLLASSANRQMKQMITNGLALAAGTNIIPQVNN